MNKEEMLQFLEEKAQEFYLLSDQIWDLAEVRFTEEKSADCYTKFFENEGFCVIREIGGLKTAFKAEWASGTPVIGFQPMLYPKIQ